MQPSYGSAAPTPEVKHIITSVGSLSDLILDGLCSYGAAD